VIGILKSVWRRPKMLDVGETAPDFAVKDHTATTRRLSDYRGRTVILWFYPKADTPG
jgi:peroxiredoxin Q/BCP